MNQLFHVVWEIDIHADTPREAAEQAFAVMQRSGTLANYFEVFDQDGVQTDIDLDEDGEES